jgi:hypothetical protein
MFRLRAMGLACLLLPAIASAQTRSSFFDVTNVFDIGVSTLDGLTYTVLLGPNPSIDYGSTTYNVTDLFGFYLLSDSQDVSATGIDQNGWGFELRNAGQGGITGWEARNANAGITPTQSISFTFTTVDLSRVDRFGFHLRYSSSFNGGGNTSYVAVPEPSSMAALALGAMGFWRMRRRTVRR